MKALRPDLIGHKKDLVKMKFFSIQYFKTRAFALAGLTALTLLGCEKQTDEGYSPSDEILVTIKPLHLIVSAVIGDTAPVPKLLMDTSASPHGFMLRPSDAADIDRADLFFYIDKDFESFLKKAIPRTQKNEVPIAKLTAEKIALYEVRENGGDHDHDHADSGKDYHIWLSPSHAMKIADVAAEKLSVLHPENKTTYERNAKNFREGLEKIDAQIKIELEPVKEKKFLVFHDAFQYFEKAYGLHNAGAVTFDPNESATASRIRQLREQIRKDDIQCIFREPQFSDRVMNTIGEGLNIRTETLDEIGASVTAQAAEGYYEYLLTLAKAYRNCLSR